MMEGIGDIEDQRAGKGGMSILGGEVRGIRPTSVLAREFEESDLESELKIRGENEVETDNGISTQ